MYKQHINVDDLPHTATPTKNTILISKMLKTQPALSMILLRAIDKARATYPKDISQLSKTLEDILSSNTPIINDRFFDIYMKYPEHVNKDIHKHGVSKRLQTPLLYETTQPLLDTESKSHTIDKYIKKENSINNSINEILRNDSCLNHVLILRNDFFVKTKINTKTFFKNIEDRVMQQHANITDIKNKFDLEILDSVDIEEKKQIFTALIKNESNIKDIYDRQFTILGLLEKILNIEEIKPAPLNVFHLMENILIKINDILILPIMTIPYISFPRFGSVERANGGAGAEDEAKEVHVVEHPKSMEREYNTDFYKNIKYIYGLSKKQSKHKIDKEILTKLIECIKDKLNDIDYNYENL